MALLMKSCLMHRAIRCATKISTIKSNVPSFQHIHRHIEPQSLLQAHRFSTTLRLSKDSDAAEGQLLIYEGALSKKMRIVKIFSLSTSAAGFMIQPYLIQSAVENSDMFGILGVSFIFFIFTIANPIFIHMLTKRYVTHLYYDEKKDEYTARTISFFLRRKEMKFQAKDVTPQELTGMFTSCEVKNTPLFVDRSGFQNPEDYDKMMGFAFDKVFPFNLDEHDVQPLDEDLHNTEKSSKDTLHVRKQKHN